MFNKGNEDYLTHPAYIPESVIDDIVKFLVDGIHTLAIKRVSLIFHGGEPLMLKKGRFVSMCEKIATALMPITKLSMSVQTNAMLVDDDWIAIFERFQIKVGVSLDGPEDYHDLARVDHQNRGTHAGTLAGVLRLQAAHQQKRINAPGAICVINPAFDARRIYRHFVDDLGLHFLSFNLPMEHHDSFSQLDIDRTTAFVEDLFQEWVADDNPNIKIRMFDGMFRFFSGDQPYQQILPNFSTRNILAVIASNGDISENDDFKIINFGQQCGNVKETSLSEFANSDVRHYIGDISAHMPERCQTCDWQNYCLAGTTHGLTVSRFSQRNGFDNPSVFCSTFQKLFSLGATYLLRNGLSVDVLRTSLDTTPWQATRSQPLPRPSPHFFSRTIPITLQPITK